MGFLANDLACETLELLARLEAEILVERPARPLVELERLRLALRAIQSDHELGDEALPVRVRLDQPLELAYELAMAPLSEIRVDSDLERPQAKLFETFGFRAALQVQGKAGEDGTAPESQGVFRELRSSSFVVCRGCLSCLVHERLEDLRVEDGRAEVDPVPAASSLESDAMRAERPAKSRHVCLEAVRRGRRRSVPPDLVDQALVGDGLARTE
jgi:hypothetical protein